MRNLITIAALIVLIGFCDHEAPAHSPRVIKRVVVLYPESDGRPGNLSFGEALQATFAQAVPYQVEVHNEYLDATLFPDESYRRQFAGFLRNKYQHLKIDGVIAPLLPSLQFLLKYRDDCFPAVPVVFAAVEERELEGVRLPLDFRGIPVRLDFAATLHLATRLDPTIKNVYVVSGSTEYDRLKASHARSVFEKNASQLNFIYLSGLTLGELEQAGRGFGPGSIVYYIHVFGDRSGMTYTPANFLDQLSTRLNVPIYGHVDTYLGRGIVGGHLMSFDTEGINAARFMLTILQGKVSDREVLENSAVHSTVVDWRQLHRWGLREADLPQGTVVHFKEPSLWDNYKWAILGVTLFCFLETFLIALLLIQRAGLRSAEERFRQTVEGSPHAKIMFAPSGRMIMVNTQAERAFGFDRSELIGKTLDCLVPDRERDRVKVQCDQFFAAPTGLTLGVGGESIGKKKDDSEFPVEIKLTPVFTNNRLHALATIVDVTERKRFEAALRETNRDLIALTGKLMHAQETERRRIARELHDDLNQNLALVSVDLDLLNQLSASRDPQLTERLTTISERVKQVSSCVHDLSHQLHPAKVEQLGLVTSLRGLCLEFGKSHDVSVEYIEHDIAVRIPTDISLCLYRIAQEALRNVTKHSRAAHATIELLCNDQDIGMVISDDGIGFDPAQSHGGAGLGLLSMQERVKLVNGIITIDSLPGRGTRLEVTIPLPEESATRRDAPMLELTGDSSYSAVMNGTPGGTPDDTPKSPAGRRSQPLVRGVHETSGAPL
jgi:PAS domain S-box-containing protein